MREHVTHAIVLSVSPTKEYDRSFECFTEHLGRITIRGISGMRMKSKLSPHCEPMKLIQMRVIEKNAFTLADAITQEIFINAQDEREVQNKAIHFLFALKHLTPKEMTDTILWEFIIRSFREKNFSIRELLTLLGYDPTHAKCSGCGIETPECFSLESHEFLCANCSALVNDEVLLW